ncbi:MAG: AsmA family protein [Proteobacteria bacterium]|nr:AsmA family protein [Pseudomonadota bacterium]
MQKKKILFAGLGTLGVLVVALLVVPGFIDWSKYQNLAQQKLRESTGYDLSIGGALRIALLPSPHASVQNIIVKKPSETEAFLAVENADVRIAFLPLLTGKIEIASVTLDKPILTLINKQNGGDNWKPVASGTASTQTDAVTGEPVKAAAAPAISIGSLKIRDGRIEMRDEAKAGKPFKVDIKDITIKAESLTGPFDVEGQIGYGAAALNVDATTGGFRAGESLPLQLLLSDGNGRAAFRFSGVVATDESKEVQGETELSYTDLAGVLADIGMKVAVPAMKTSVTGMLTASPDKVLLTNGALELGTARLSMKLDAQGLQKGPMSITAIIDSKEILDLNMALETASAVAAKSEKKSDEKAGQKAAESKKSTSLIPSDFELPKDMKADIQIRGKGLEYKRKKTGAFELRATVGEGKNDFRATIASIPGGGDISLSAALVSKGVVEGVADVSIGSLKLIFAEWLGLADEAVFENPSMPRRIDTTASFRLAGSTVTLNVQPLSIGETKLNGTIAYTVGARPLLNLKLAGNVWTMPEDKQKNEEAKKEGTEPKKAEADKKPEFKLDLPQLPFDLKFDVTLGRLIRGDTALTDVKAAGSYDSKKLVLTAGSATVSGGTLSATGAIADVKALSGLDVNAGLATSDLEGFVKAMTGKPLALNKTVGAFNGSVKAKGDKSKLDINATLKAWGFTVEASGGVNDPFEADIPSSVSVRVRHPSFVNAVRVFSPGFGAGEGTGKPIDLAGLVAISDNTYEVTGLKGVVGGSDIAGSLKAVMGGVPSYTAAITSNKLDVGALVGVDSKTVSSKASGNAAASAGSTAQAAVSPWSREPLDTGFMKSLNLDLDVSAGTLLYGTWTLKNAKMDVTLKDGVLKASPIAGNLFDGSFDAALTASSAGTKSPLNIDFKADVTKVAIGPFLSALMSSPKKMADGTGSVSLAMKGAGISSGALMASLTGKADIKAEKPVIYGMDIDKLAANIVEAFDGGWKGVIAGLTTEGFSGGSTSFKDIDHSFVISNGEMPVKDFKLETVNANAVVTSNGNISFTRWYMDINSSVNVTQPKDVPVIGLRIYGPLSSPSKTVNSQALDNLIRSKIQSEIGDKVQGIVSDKLKGTAAEGIVNQVLPGLFGGQPQQAPAPAPTQAPVPAPDAAPVPTQPQTQQQAPAPTPQEQILNGIINQLGR